MDRKEAKTAAGWLASFKETMKGCAADTIPEVDTALEALNEKAEELFIPPCLRDAGSLLIYVPDRHCAVVVSPGCGDAWLPSDDEDFPGCDEYLNWTLARFEGPCTSEALFKEADGGIFLYSREDYPVWQDAIAPCLKQEVFMLADDDELPQFIVLDDGQA